MFLLNTKKKTILPIYQDNNLVDSKKIIILKNGY